VYDNDLPTRPFPLANLLTERGDWALRYYEEMLERMSWLDTDRIPYLDVYTGTEIFAEAFGCDTYQPEEAMPHAKYLVNSAVEARKIMAPKLEDTTLMRLFDIADRLRREAGPDVIFKLPDIQSPLGTAALIWDKTDFMASLLLYPEDVRHLAAQVTQLVIDFYDEWTSRYGASFIAHYPEYYMPDGITFSEDDVGIIDDQMFRDFYKPEIVKLIDRYGPIGIHCCADSRHQWENFATLPDLRVINLRIENKDMEFDSYNTYKCVHMNQRVPESAPETWKDHYPDQTRAIIRTGAATKEEAIALSQILGDM
jgi:uroporphyrinogen-III decarboxylase